MMSGVLLVILLLVLGLTWLALSGSAERLARERLDRGGDQLATVASRSLSAALSRMESRVRDGAIVRALDLAERDRTLTREETRRAIEEAGAELRRLLPAADSTLVIELWSDDGRRVAWAGRDLRADVPVTAAGSEEHQLGIPRRGLEGLTRSDSAQVGPFHQVGDSVHFWLVAPVRVGQERKGWVLRQSLLREGSGDETIDALVGSGARIYYRNRTNGFWTTMEGRPSSAPEERRAGREGLMFRRADVPSDLIASEESIRGTPFMIVFEQPLDTVLAPARRTITRLALLSLLPLLGGIVASWAISRRITRPLRSLTHAAERVAAGDFDVRVRPGNAAELARLARGFNHMAQEVGRSRRDLEQSVAELDEARAIAETASRAKSDFLAVMSHELRTPLNAIGGYVELMELGIRGPVTDMQLRDLERIRASQQHLLGLIGGVLDLSRIEAGSVVYDLTSIEIGPFLEGLDALVGPQAEAKSLSLQHAPWVPGLCVRADREKLRQILLNLLSNAIRYTPPEGSIRLAAVPASDETVAVTVEDTGVGIPEEALARVFEPFVQLDRSLTRPRDGVGLGLAISRDLARGMGGDLMAESIEGVGSCFTLTLRRAEADPRSAMRTSGETRTVDGVRA